MMEPELSCVQPFRLRRQKPKGHPARIPRCRDRARQEPSCPARCRAAAPPYRTGIEPDAQGGLCQSSERAPDKAFGVNPLRADME
jgi:hypothetical protein